MNDFKTCIAFGNVPQYKEYMISLQKLGSDYDYEEIYIRHNVKILHKIFYIK